MQVVQSVNTLVKSHASKLPGISLARQTKDTSRQINGLLLKQQAATRQTESGKHCG